jgi:hypothetical protein
MQLQRYHLWCIKSLIASKNEYIVKFNGKTNSSQWIIFASPLEMANATLVSQYLSLTYLPRHRYGFDSNSFKLLDNEGNEITSQNPYDFLRVWPAFGKYGGGIEVLIELNDSEITPLSDNILLDGGAIDRFHRDAILPLTMQILESISNGTRTIFEDANGIGLVREGLPIFKWQRNEDNFTISVGIKETPDGMILHIWGTKWRDSDSFRHIYCILESEFQAFSIGRVELENRFKNWHDIYFIEFSKKVNDVVKGLRECKGLEHPLLICCVPQGPIFRLP